MEPDTPSLDEGLRRDALERQQITDMPEEENFDRVVRLACAALETPVGLISFVDGERQWFKARKGLDARETPREHAFGHALDTDEVMVVEDATHDPRFADNPLVTCDNGIRFYAGAPLKTREGFNLGTLCVIDHIPRKINSRDRALLKDMAGIVVNEMELTQAAGHRHAHRPLHAAFPQCAGQPRNGAGSPGGYALYCCLHRRGFFQAYQRHVRPSRRRCGAAEPGTGHPPGLA